MNPLSLRESLGLKEERIDEDYRIRWDTRARWHNQPAADVVGKLPNGESRYVTLQWAVADSEGEA